MRYHDVRRTSGTTVRLLERSFKRRLDGYLATDQREPFSLKAGYPAIVCRREIDVPVELRAFEGMEVSQAESAEGMAYWPLRFKTGPKTEPVDA